MTQNQWIVLLLKAGLVSGFVSIAVWIGVYTKLAPWWRNPIGRSLVLKSSLVALLFIPSILSIFLHFNRMTSRAAAWVDVALIGLITPVMLWRTVVFWRLDKAEHDIGGGEPPI